MPTGLMRCFIVPPNAAGQDTSSVYYDGFLDTCFLYDQAVALVGLPAARRAGRRGASWSMRCWPCRTTTAASPFSSGQATLYDRTGAGFIRIGAVAWVCYALLLCDQPQFRSWFAATPTGAAARRCLDYILGFTNSIGTVNGGKGQYVNGVLDPAYVVPWWSVEHNIDTWWCLDLADRLYGSGTVNYREAADVMQAALLTTGYGWDGTDGIFWQGGVAARRLEHARRHARARHPHLGRGAAHQVDPHLRCQPLAPAGEPVLLRDRHRERAVGLHDLHPGRRLSIEHRPHSLVRGQLRRRAGDPRASTSMPPTC